MKRYKLTDQDMKTYGGFQWKLGETRTTSGKGDLCGPGWLHCYSNPDLAILLNPLHAGFNNPRLFEVECSGEHKEYRGLKEGFTEITLITELTVPIFTNNQKIAFGILCALEVYKDTKYEEWAKNWLNGTDRTIYAAVCAANAASIVAANTTYLAINSTNSAINAAANAATYAANAAKHTKNTATCSAYAAVFTTDYITFIKGQVIDFIAIIEKVKSLTL